MRARSAGLLFLVFQGKIADVQSEPNPACWGAVCTGADWSLSTLAPTPTATSQKKDKLTENSTRMHFIVGNNNTPILSSRTTICSRAFICETFMLPRAPRIVYFGGIYIVFAASYSAGHKILWRNLGLRQLFVLAFTPHTLNFARVICSG